MNQSIPKKPLFPFHSALCVISFIVAFFRLTGKISLSVEESGNPVIGGLAYGADGFSKVFSGWNNGVVEPIR